MATPAGFEPATYGLGIRRFILLSYGALELSFINYGPLVFHPCKQRDESVRKRMALGDLQRAAPQLHGVARGRALARRGMIAQS